MAEQWQHNIVFRRCHWPSQASTEGVRCNSSSSWRLSACVRRGVRAGMHLIHGHLPVFVDVDPVERSVFLLGHHAWRCAVAAQHLEVHSKRSLLQTAFSKCVFRMRRRVHARAALGALVRWLEPPAGVSPGPPTTTESLLSSFCSSRVRRLLFLRVFHFRIDLVHLLDPPHDLSSP